MITDRSREMCGAPPPVKEANLVKFLRDVFHFTRSPTDVANKKGIRGIIVEHFDYISKSVEKATVEEQRFSVPGQVRVLSPKAV